MVGFARSILEANERAQRYFAGSQLRGRVRFGTSEDFVSSRLPEVLRDFVQRHPLVDLELTVDLSATLNSMLDDGALDVVLCKRRAGDDRGRLVWRDRLAWIGTEKTRGSIRRQPLPLILYTPPSITRTVALETLERAGRPWRIVCSSGSLSGLRAAALAGLGVTVHARGLMPEGLVGGAGGLSAAGTGRGGVRRAGRRRATGAVRRRRWRRRSWRTATGCRRGSRRASRAWGPLAIREIALRRS